MSEQRRMSLLDLPNELVFGIAQHVDAPMSLMMTCHCLYSIVYPQFLKRSAETCSHPLIALHWAVTMRNETLFRLVFPRVPYLVIYDPDDPDNPSHLAIPWPNPTLENLDEITARVMAKPKTIRLEQSSRSRPDFPKVPFARGKRHARTALGYAVASRRLNMVKYFTEVLEPAVMFRCQGTDSPLAISLIDHEWIQPKTSTATLILRTLLKTAHPKYRVFGPARPRHNFTPLHLAVLNGWGEEARSLALRGALFNARNANGFTPLIMAVTKDNYEMVEVLIELNPSSFLKQAKEAVAMAKEKRNWSLVKYMMAESLRLAGTDSVYGWGALHTAVKDQDEGLVEELLGEGLNVNAQDNNGRTPLHLAVNDQEASITIVMLLIKNGAKVSAKDHRGKTPLHLAAGQLSLSAVKTLLQEGADVNAKDSDGNGPLEIARRFPQLGYYQDVLSILIKGGAVRATQNSGTVKEPKKDGI